MSDEPSYTDLMFEIKDLQERLTLSTAREAQLRAALEDVQGDGILRSVIALANEHHAKQTWCDKPETYWLNGLTEEYLELHLALDGNHEHTPDLELTQIASCAINWLRHRADLATP